MGDSTMKFFYIYLLSFSSLILQENVFAETAGQVPVTIPQTESAPQTPNFTSTQVTEIQKIVADYLTKNPAVVTASFQAGMELEQKEAVAKTEKAVAENKDKIFKNLKDPVQGNPKGSQSLVVFLDPNCGYCK